MAPLSPTTDALCARFGEYASLVEIGIGRRPAVASALASRGVTVTATDVRTFEVPSPVRFVRDDAWNPDLTVYDDADAIYALNCPPELHRPIHEIARTVGAPFYFTTLGTDRPAIPAATETIPGDTLFRTIDRGPGNDRLGRPGRNRRPSARGPRERPNGRGDGRDR